MKFIFKLIEPGKIKDWQLFRTKIKFPECNTEEHIDTIIKSFLYQRIYKTEEFTGIQPYCFDGFYAKYGRLPDDNDVIEITFTGSPYKEVQVINVDEFEMVYYSYINWRLVKSKIK